MIMRKRARGLAAAVGGILVVLAGVGLAAVVGMHDWIGILIVAFLFGVMTGSVGVARSRR